MAAQAHLAKRATKIKAAGSHAKRMAKANLTKSFSKLGGKGKKC
jgi:hypothetical protein